jgi:alkylation response protein AidB-like acyl-CoA dehydrogenase
MTADEQHLSAFRRRAREWLQANAGADTQQAVPSDTSGDLAKAKRFQAALHDAGFAGITWPAEYGGQGLGQAEQLAFNDVAKDFDLPVDLFVIGMGMCGPTVVDLGTDAQKSRYVRPLLRGEEIWCQLFSEPAAGSDVASLRTRAVPDGDAWVLNGQKVWTTGAQLADFGAVLARTNLDVPKHKGLTMFIVDMRAPGVTVRPLRVMTGTAPFNEVYFSDVRLPSDAVIGEVDNGWHAAVTMLGHERVSIGTSVRRKSNPLAFSALVQTAKRHRRDTDPVVRDKLVELYLQEWALALFTTRLRQEANAGRDPGARGSVAKLVSAQLGTQAVDVAGLVAGPEVVAWDPDDEWAAELSMAVNGTPGMAIAGGTNEIQRNIIGERVLGLPKEPQVDQDVPVRDLKVGTQRD